MYIRSHFGSSHPCGGLGYSYSAVVQAGDSLGVPPLFYCLLNLCLNYSSLSFKFPIAHGLLQFVVASPSIT